MIQCIHSCKPMAGIVFTEHKFLQYAYTLSLSLFLVHNEGFDTKMYARIFFLLTLEVVFILNIYVHIFIYYILIK